MNPLRSIAFSPQLNSKQDKQDPKLSEKGISSIAFLSSAIGGYVGGYVCFPFEGLKKRLQRRELNRSDFLALTNRKVIYAMHPLRLFQGSLSFATSVTLSSTSSITANILLRTGSYYDPSSTLHNLSSAIGSGMLGSLIGSTPVENTILIQQELNVGPSKAFKHMLKEGGIFRPWVGARELMIREGGFAGVMLYGGPAAHQFVIDKTQDKKLALLAELFIGSLAALITHPADTLATFRQKQGGKVGVWEAAKTLWTHGYKNGPKGMRAFCPGAFFRVFLFVGCATIIPRAAEAAESILSNHMPK